MNHLQIQSIHQLQIRINKIESLKTLAFFTPRTKGELKARTAAVEELKKLSGVELQKEDDDDELI